jgi:hypothetical protein
MTDAEIKEDRFIRWALIAVPTLLVLGFLASSVLAAAMLSANFNFLNWFE